MGCIQKPSHLSGIAICTAIQHPVTFSISIDHIIRHKLLMQSYKQFSIHEKLLLFFVLKRKYITAYYFYALRIWIKSGGSFGAQVHGLDLLTKLIRTHNREPTKLIQFPIHIRGDFLALCTHYDIVALMTCIY